MPDPREAIYDVLLAKKQRADEQRRRAEVGTAEAEAWQAYLEANERAHVAYRAKGVGGRDPR